MRLKDYVTGAEIKGNTIKDCGIHDYRFDWGSKNGEGIYIGTSSRQVRAQIPPDEQRSLQFAMRRSACEVLNLIISCTQHNSPI